MEALTKCLVVFIHLSTFFFSTSLAYTFLIGGGKGVWVQTPSEPYNTWAERSRFSVNDTIVFKYRKGDDSVLQVSKADYDSCNTNSPIQKLDGGDSAFQFDRSGPFYFISGVSGHCQNGQKVVVVVLAVRNKKPSPTTPPSSSPAPTPSPSPLIAPTSPSPSPSTNLTPVPSPSPLIAPTSPSPSPSTNLTPVPSPSSSPTPSSSAPEVQPPNTGSGPSGSTPNTPSGSGTGPVTTPPPPKSSSSIVSATSGVVFGLLGLVLGSVFLN